MLNKAFFVFASLVVCAVQLHAQSLYRCGNTFQQTPCDGEGNGAITVKEAFSSSGGDRHAGRKVAAQGLDEAAFNAFYLKGMPAVGMSAQQLAKVLGEPLRVSSKKTKAPERQQHVYEKDGRRVHVQLRDGVATRIAYRAAAGKSAKETNRSQAARSCPTELEIRNAKVGANSLTLSPKERAKRQKAIEKMERCGKESPPKRKRGS